MLGGGFKSPSGEAFAQVFPEESFPFGDNAWRVHVMNGAFASASSFRAFAVCQRKPGALEQKRHSKDVDPGQTTATAICDRGDHLVGGGFTIDGDTKDATDGTVVASHPSEATEGWSVTIDSIEDDLRLKAHAICRERKPVTRVIVNGPIDVPPLSTKTTEVDCPNKAPEVLNGGFLAAGIPVASFPASKDSWEVTVVNPSGGGTTSFFAYALCQ